MASEPQADQQEMQNLERQEGRLLREPLVAEDLRSWFAGRAEMLNRPMDEVAPEGLGCDEADTAVLRGMDGVSRAQHR